jgi:hypothetical protein
MDPAVGSDDEADQLRLGAHLARHQAAPERSGVL